MQVEEAKGANAIQESLKRQLKVATKVANAKLRKAYITVSGMLDMAMAAVDKTSDTPRNFRRIRSRIKRPDRDDMQVEPVKPVAEPVK